MKPALVAKTNETIRAEKMPKAFETIWKTRKIDNKKRIEVNTLDHITFVNSILLADECNNLPIVSIGKLDKK
jgi:hypothetical protein